MFSQQKTALVIILFSLCLAGIAVGSRLASRNAPSLPLRTAAEMGIPPNLPAYPAPTGVAAPIPDLRLRTAAEMGIPPNLPTLTPEPTGVAAPIATPVQWAGPDEAARRELPRLLGAVSAQWKDFGFQNEGELDRVVLGAPAAEYFLDWEKLRQYERGQQSFSDFLVDKQIWQYPSKAFT